MSDESTASHLSEFLSEYDDEGGWQSAVGNLVRWLRANSCTEYAHEVERHLQSLSPSSPPQVEARALDSILLSLALIRNEPPKHLSPVQRKEVKELWKKAQEFVQVGRERCRNWIEIRNRAVKGVESRLREKSAPERSEGSERHDDTGRQYVTLDQAAASVGRSKRTLEKLRNRKKNPMPDPDICGGGGKPNEWLWAIIRPWLEKEYGRTLPAVFPATRS